MADQPNAKQAYINQRLTDELVIWLSTVRPDGHPHTVPMEFYWTGEYVYFTTDQRSQKAVNLGQNPYVTLALPDGADVVILEGAAEFVDQSTVALVYAPLAAKNGRGPRLDPAARLVRVTPRKVLAWGGPYERAGS